VSKKEFKDDDDDDGTVKSKLDWEEFQPLRFGWNSEVIGNQVSFGAWDKLVTFDGECPEPQELVADDEAERAADADTGANPTGVTDDAGDATTKGDFEPDENNYAASNIWEKLEKFGTICTVPDFTRGYTVKNNRRLKEGNANEIVFKITPMVEFWSGNTDDPTEFPPEDDDVARMLYYLIYHWDTYTDEAQDDADSADSTVGGDILKVDPKGALVFAVAGRHARISDPTVVFKRIESKEDDRMNMRTLEMEGEITGSEIEIEDEDGLDLDLTALLRMFTVHSGLQKYVWERLASENKEGTLDASDQIDVTITPRIEEGVIEFEVTLQPVPPGIDRG